MITENFYPTAYTADGIQYTDFFNALPEVIDIETDPCSAYYMGSIPANLITSIIPHTFKIIPDENDPLNTVIKFEKNTTISKADWGYADGQTYANAIYWNGSKYLQSGIIRLINSLEAYKYTKWGTVSIGFRLYVYFDQTLSSGDTIQISDTYANSSVALTYAQFIDFIKNDTAITVSFTINGQTETYQLKYSDLTDFKLWSVSTDRIIECTAISDTNAGYYGNTTTRYINPFFHINSGLDNFGHYSRVGAAAFPTSVLRIQFTPELDTFKYCDAVMGVNNSFSSTFSPNANTDAIIYSDDFSITGEFLDYVRRNGYTHEYYIKNNAVFSYTGYSNVTIEGVSRTMYQVGFRTAFNIRDFWTMFCLHNKCKNTSYDTSTDYNSTHTIGMFTANNQPVPDRAAFTTYPEIEPDLQKWQKYGFNIIDDDYSPGEEPGGGDRPDPDVFPDGENVGEDIETPDSLGVGSTLGFVTQYVLNASQISQLGSILWTSFTDPDYWKNFMFSLALDTGSFNTSSMLDYFISLRVYPFSLINVPGCSSFGQDMFVGSGYVPLHFTTNLYALNNYAEILQAGKLKLPFVFGDFRDCTNMEITLYLPYCGTVQLEPADVLGGTLTAKYAIDFATGSCTAIVDLETWDGHKYPIAILPGQIGADVPMSGTAAGQIAARLGSDVLNVAGILTAGAVGIGDSVKMIGIGALAENPEIITGGVINAAGTIGGTALGLTKQGLEMAARPGIGAPTLAGGRGFSSFGAPQKAYVQIRAPLYDAPDNYSSTAGYPAAKEVTVSSCTGLCRFINPDVSKITASDAEKNEIRSQLQAGIII